MFSELFQVTMDMLQFAFNNMPLEHQIDDLLAWIEEFRENRKYFRKDLRVKAVLTCTLEEAKALLRVKVRERELCKLFE